MTKVSQRAKELSAGDVERLDRAFESPPARHSQLLLAMRAADDLAVRFAREAALRDQRSLAAGNLYAAVFGRPTDADLWSAEEVGRPFDGALSALGCAIAADLLRDVLDPQMRRLLLAPWSEVFGDSDLDP